MIGFIGLGVMGDNLVLNLLDKGEKVLVFNRTQQKAQQFVSENRHPNLSMAKSYQELCQLLPAPRVVFLMVKAGEAVDQTISQLSAHLSPGDYIIDGGNSFYKDSIRRFHELKNKKIHFIDMGVSGGAMGARLGPSMMMGGEAIHVEFIQSIFAKVAAQTPVICFDHMGGPGFGHFVKMVHNGIEYAQMQLLAEVYSYLKRYSLDHHQLSQFFDRLAKQALPSYLVEITAKILQFSDSEGIVIDRILDVASEKGTGRWTSFAALELGVPAGIISSALEARFISQQKSLRQELAKNIPTASLNLNKKMMNEELMGEVISFANLLCYLQGIEIILAFAQEQKVEIDFRKIVQVWRSGCIIRSSQLDLMASFSSNKPFEAQEFKVLLEKHIDSFAKFIEQLSCAKEPAPVFSAAFNYVLSLSRDNSSASLIQAQRDFFGAHTYQRNDRPGTYHTEWEKL